MRTKIAAKVAKILANFDIGMDNPDYLFLRDNAIAAREMGLSWARVERMIEDSLS